MGRTIQRNRRAVYINQWIIGPERPRCIAECDNGIGGMTIVGWGISLQKPDEYICRWFTTRANFTIYKPVTVIWASYLCTFIGRCVRTAKFRVTAITFVFIYVTRAKRFFFASFRWPNSIIDTYAYYCLYSCVYVLIISFYLQLYRGSKTTILYFNECTARVLCILPRRLKHPRDSNMFIFS